MRYDGMVDPALALYAAYAFHDLQSTGRIRELRESLKDEVEISFFDLELLSGDAPRPPGRPACFPPFPLLAHGWSLLPAFGVSLPDGFAGIESELLPSLWTHFNAAGARRLSDLMLARRLQ
jgi:hypothetical protein